MARKKGKRFPDEDFHRDRLALLESHPVLKGRKPLKIGIHKDLETKHPDMDPLLIQSIVRYQVNGLDYLKAMAKGGMRYDLEGQPVEEVTDGHRAFAAKRIETIKRAMKKKAGKKSNPIREKMVHSQGKARRPLLRLKKKENAA